MTYETAKTLREAALALVPDVIAAGERLGYWTRAEDQPQGTREFPFFFVRDAEGLTFELSAGIWEYAGKIGCRVATLRRDGLAVSPRDVVAYSTKLPTAYADHKRGAEAIAKDLYRRVTGTEQARDIAAKVLKALDARLESRVSLDRLTEALRGLGFEVHNMDRESFSQRTLYHRDLGRATLCAGGRLTMDHIALSTANLDRLATVLNLLKECQ